MAVSDIQATVLANTGRTPTANSVEDAQRFVASSIPKDLLIWAQNASSASTDGSAISFTSTDSIIDVQRNGYSCKEIPLSESIFALSSSSLKKATSTHPVWYHKQGAIHFAPVTDGSNAGYIFYVDYSKIDDDSDLRNAVINYSTYREFTALSISSAFPTLNWSEQVPPVSPAAPSFTTPDISTATAPTFTPPIMGNLDFTDTNTWISTEEDSEMLASRVQEIQAKISEYSALLQSAQLDFNKNNAEYQALVQEAQQEASLKLNKESQEYSAKLQKYQAELQDYQASVNQTIQSNQGEVSEWQAENSVKLGHYSQMAVQYYNWSQAEIKNYIENNTKTFDKIVDVQKGKQ